jgi:geranylgeranyl diphosphate synthase type II
MISDVKATIKRYAAEVDEALDRYLPQPGGAHAKVIEAMRYSALAGGKRIRPVLMLEFARICGAGAAGVMPFACAEEMIHTYSLIHDDLPCMDDDCMRRGRPSCHVKFGEATALLAGDALLSLAFETALCDNNVCDIMPDNAVRAVRLLARASGAQGMVGGQTIDVESEGRELKIGELENMHRMKTGAMIVAAAQMGCILAGADEKKTAAAGEYASRVGLAFQIIDDCLDVAGSRDKLGKPIGSDSHNCKTTYVTLLGLDAARQRASELTDEAVSQLGAFGGSEFLSDLAKYLCGRDR